MVKQKQWIKKRTSRGNGRSINRRSRPTAKNIDRDIRKNQLVYSRYLLKFVIVFALGLVWLQLGIRIGNVTVLPIGLIAAMGIIFLEKFAKSRRIELALVLISTILSYVFPIGIVL